MTWFLEVSEERDEFGEVVVEEVDQVHLLEMWLGRDGMDLWVRCFRFNSTLEKFCKSFHKQRGFFMQDSMMFKSFQLVL